MDQGAASKASAKAQERRRAMMTNDERKPPNIPIIIGCVAIAIFFTMCADYQFDHHRYGMFVFSLVYVVSFLFRVMRELEIIK